MILAQHGHNSKRQIISGLEGGFIDGVIISPQYITENNLSDFIQEIKTKKREAVILFDTLSYLANLNVGIPTKVSSYNYFETIDNIWSVQPEAIEDFVKKHLNVQKDLDVTYTILPTLRLDSFNSATAMIDNQIKSVGIEYATEQLRIDKSDLLASICVNDNAFSVDCDLESYLQRLTLLPVKGFYLIVESSYSNSSFTNASVISRVMYAIDSLKRRGYEVYIGYTDVIGLLYTVAGATALANGFYKNTKVFQSSRFNHQGGRGIPSRIFLKSLLASIRIQPDFKQLEEANLLEEIMGEDLEGLDINLIDSEWQRQIHYYWENLSKINDEIGGKTSLEEKINVAEDLIDKAERNYAIIKGSNITLESDVNGRYLPEWKRAITLFKSNI